jgi:hypothetical protein
MAPRGRFELPTFRLTAEMLKTPSALFGVGYGKNNVIFAPSVGLLLGYQLNAAFLCR